MAYLYEHRLGGVLADDMGLGKTIQALALMCHTKERGLTDAPYLVVAPTSVVGNWAAECRRFAPGLRRRHRHRDRVAAGGWPWRRWPADVDLVITSYALFRLEYDDYAALAWAGLFLDEAQFAKNRASQAYRRAKMLPAPFKVAMTGTPIENNLMELWSLLSITAPGLFPSPDRFTDHYRTPIEKKADAERLAQLRRRVRPLILRRTKEQVVRDLPEKQEQVLELDLNPRHKKLYQTYLHRERQKVLGLLGDMQKNRFEIFRSLTLLRQASLDMSLVDATHADGSLHQARRPHGDARGHRRPTGTGSWSSASSPGSSPWPGAGSTRPGSTTATSTAEPANATTSSTASGPGRLPSSSSASKPAASAST